jgi:hypothetical protein
MPASAFPVTSLEKLWLDFHSIELCVRQQEVTLVEISLRLAATVSRVRMIWFTRIASEE